VDVVNLSLLDAYDLEQWFIHPHFLRTFATYFEEHWSGIG